MLHASIYLLPTLPSVCRIDCQHSRAAFDIMPEANFSSEEGLSVDGKLDEGRVVLPRRGKKNG
ncbi:hypothetical protein Fmac_012241 [Flemingia macrophylla]|uniref:Uncharacterized protein n=1 Tax=Flemingia macrophylla TaxID=520843 RepID=A0ABD1MPR9_9FABA